ncbi:MAG: UDP-N-acetylenolpyruvoylglucosamine reductase [Candidatus Doudnabacteria bacterium RIFCSPHIGHO2_01_FULL_46_14]|uniref:UDP-N-acetylenolpyruvoylglucosamine reductase n=1 Tax=Candidatus Doudnabacteria bacterium RIFCSPHIGHO2_01_FULL_46_14 TaxID=1817824 RepID=A0A1F5NNH5_9BACT|nr:MAG: UDP-N-acetylenolpyruvoylglucosamine reductase [Candidatus Doudnabacteria bacterium RIFCSPHIGHO2_01_FULL_46_14]
MKIKKDFPLKKFTTISIGGAAKYFVVIKKENELVAAIQSAKKFKLPWYVVGEGSNLIVSDTGYQGVIIQNQIKDFEQKGLNTFVGSGYSLLRFVLEADKLGMAGMERMAGIPGTVGGAIYGCAGAYGQEIKDHLVSVRFFDGKEFRNLTKHQCRFRYRSSIFKKHKNWVIVGVEFELEKGNARQLLKISHDIIKLRAIKYKSGLKCPGSFFKNLIAAEIKVPAVLKDQIVYGKLPAGVLLEQIGAKGMHEGNIRVADHHANLIYNPGNGLCSDVRKLSTRLKTLVKKRFGIIIDEEVQYLGFTNN